MLLELAIGDAYGAGFEFAPQEKIEKYNDLSGYQTHGLGMPAGCYTDDTQMSLALAELLIEGQPWTRETIADKFVACYKRDHRLGYSTGFQLFLDSIDSGTEFLARIQPESTRNGAAMRAAPLGIIADIPQLLEMAAIQASLTHDTPEGIESAQAIALASHYFAYQLGDKTGLVEFVSQYTHTDWNDQWSEPVPCRALETVHAVLTLLVQCHRLGDMLIRGVNFGGDVDTVTALALSIASQSGQYDQTLPDFLFRDLETGDYGHDYLVRLDNQFSQLKHTI